MSGDNYLTPMPYCHQIVRILQREGRLQGPLSVLEPAAGDGRIVRWLRFFNQEASVRAIEIDKNHLPSIARSTRRYDMVDYLTWAKGKARERFDVIVTNPPFSLAEDFIRTSLTLLKPNGYALFLLRLGFLAGKGRNDAFWSKYDYDKMYVLSSRPRFDGRSDFSEYAWFRFPYHAYSTTQANSDSKSTNYQPYMLKNFARTRHVQIEHLPTPATIEWDLAYPLQEEDNGWHSSEHPRPALPKAKPGRKPYRRGGRTT